MYSARLTRQEKRKDSNDMQDYIACGFIASVESITKSASLYSIFISSVLVHYVTILYKHLCYFQAGGKQSDFLFPSSIFHLLVLTTVLDMKQAVPDCPAIRELMPPAGYPEKHTPRLYPRHKQDQPITLLSWVSRSPSKLGLQAPTPESRTQCGARTSSTKIKP